LVGDGSNLLRDGEYHVEVLAIEKFGLAALDPLRAGQRLALRAMPISAGAIANTLMAARITLFDLTAQGCGPAHFDGSHDAPLRCGHRPAMLFPIALAIAAEYIRHFPLRAIHGRVTQKY